MPDNNRIGSACWYRLAKFRESEQAPEGPWKTGHLRAWSTDHEENTSGFGPFPVGVVEDDLTGLVHSIYVRRICFAAVPPRE